MTSKPEPTAGSPNAPPVEILNLPMSERIAQYRALEQMALLRAETTNSAELRQSYLELRERWAKLAEQLEQANE